MKSLDLNFSEDELNSLASGYDLYEDEYMPLPKDHKSTKKEDQNCVCDFLQGNMIRVAWCKYPHKDID